MKPKKNLRNIKTYIGLVRAYRPVMIKTQRECDRALAVTASLVGFRLTKQQSEYLGVVSTLIYDYEREMLARRGSKFGMKEVDQ